MAGKRKKTTGGSQVQKHQSGIPERKEGLKTENVVLGNCRLPLEICQHLFKKLDSEEKITFSRALTTWHELVSKERPDFLCQKGAPTLIEHLPRKSLLQCRTLSRSWTQAQDRHYQEHPAHVRLPFEIANCRKNRIPMLINRFNSTDAVQKFLEDMRDHPGNPFPGSNVEITMYGSLRLEMDFYNNNLVPLFERFGKYIYNVLFTRIKLHFFRKCLIKLPNLKGLRIIHSSENPFLSISKGARLPRLRNLEMLELQFVSSPFRELVLDSCPIPKNMKRLSIERYCFNRTPEIVFSFINLEVFKGRIDILDFQRFSKLARPPPLREVELLFFKRVEVYEVFKALEPFANTLVHLTSERMTTYDHLKWINTDINLPKLTKLTLDEFKLSLDPFIKFTSLTDLAVAIPDSQNYVEESQVEFHGFEKPFDDSNIWKLIPSLNKIIVGYYNTFHRPLPPKQNRRSKRKCVLNAKKYV